MKPKPLFVIVDANGYHVWHCKTEQGAIAIAKTNFQSCKVVEYRAVMRKAKPIVGFDLVD